MKEIGSGLHSGINNIAEYVQAWACSVYKQSFFDEQKIGLLQA